MNIEQNHTNHRIYFLIYIAVRQILRHLLFYYYIRRKIIFVCARIIEHSHEKVKFKKEKKKTELSSVNNCCWLEYIQPANSFIYTFGCQWESVVKMCVCVVEKKIKEKEKQFTNDKFYVRYLETWAWQFVVFNNFFFLFSKMIRRLLLFSNRKPFNIFPMWKKRSKNKQKNKQKCVFSRILISTS